MATKFFIGGNKFYDSEEEANAELMLFEVEHNIPVDTFVVVKIDKQESKDAPADTFKPATAVH